MSLEERDDASQFSIVFSTPDLKNTCVVFVFLATLTGCCLLQEMFWVLCVRVIVSSCLLIDCEGSSGACSWASHRPPWTLRPPSCAAGSPGCHDCDSASWRESTAAVLEHSNLTYRKCEQLIILHLQHAPEMEMYTGQLYAPMLHW